MDIRRLLVRQYFARVSRHVVRRHAQIGRESFGGPLDAGKGGDNVVVVAALSGTAVAGEAADGDIEARATRDISARRILRRCVARENGKYHGGCGERSRFRHG
jgi:hypothetical protein